MVLIFVFWNISFKACNNACIMPSFGKKTFSSIFTQCFTMNDTVNFQDNFFVQFYLLSNHNFPFKVYTTDCIMPGFDKQFIFNNFTLWFKGKLFR